MMCKILLFICDHVHMLVYLYVYIHVTKVLFSLKNDMCIFPTLQIGVRFLNLL